MASATPYLRRRCMSSWKGRISPVSKSIATHSASKMASLALIFSRTIRLRQGIDLKCFPDVESIERLCCLSCVPAHVRHHICIRLRICRRIFPESLRVKPNRSAKHGANGLKNHHLEVFDAFYAFFGNDVCDSA